jgi:hypothetical protein
MLTRVILKTDQWRVVAGILGWGAVRAVNATGESVAATAAEKDYFLEVLHALRQAGIRISAQSPVAVNVVTDFAKAIHQRSRRTTTAGGFAYTAFFSTYSPEETARRYIEKVSN